MTILAGMQFFKVILSKYEFIEIKLTFLWICKCETLKFNLSDKYVQ